MSPHGLTSAPVPNKPKPVPGLLELHWRRAINADIPAVRALVFGVLTEYGLKPDPTGTDADLADIETAYATGCFIVLETGTLEIIGSIAWLPAGDVTMEIRKLYLARAWRGRGLGNFLLRHALAEARVQNVRQVVLETATVLREAHQLYLRHGFLPYSPTHAAPRSDLAMKLDLQPPTN